ncbi:MAG: hypothetical protein RQ826_08785 [Xanthomonadales bacterium]|nr:hypothetical protein [Xanthomonadales bacterium]
MLVPLVFGVYIFLPGWIKELGILASSDPEAARDEAIRRLRLSAWSFCIVMFVFCVYFFRYCQLGRREGRLPPSGWWSLGALRAIVGPKARRMSEVGLVLSAVLLAASIGFGFAVEHLVRLIERGMFAT